MSLPPPLPSTIEDLATAFYDAYNRHDSQAVADLYQEDGRHVEIAFGAERIGQTALRQGFEALLAVMPDVSWQERERIKAADSIALVYEMTGTFTAPPGAGDHTNSPRLVRLTGLHLLDIAGGRIAVSRDYWDKTAFLAQIA